MVSKLLLLCLISLFILTKETYSQKFDAEVINYTTLCEVGTSKLVQTDSITLQINNRTGDKYTDISIPFSKNEKISDLEAWIENMDGTKVRDLKKSEIIDKSAITDMSLYEDNFNRCFRLTHNSYPYKVIYTYKTTYRDFITIARWGPIIYSAIPTRNAKLNIILPKGFQYTKYVNNISEECHIDSTQNNIILQWKAAYDTPIKSEVFSQPNNIKPFVIVAPLHFEYGIAGSSKDWESFGNWVYGLIQGLDVLPEDEKNKITALITGMTDKKEIIKTLYHYLQDHTRYINVTIGIGGFKPYPASYVAQNKYGDCKALTNYMKAMLSFAGIESFYTIVYGSNQPLGFIKSFVGQQFNHVVLTVPLEKDTIWLENTSNTNPFSYMGTFTQNRDALLIAKDHSQLVRIPALKTDDNHVSYTLAYDLNLSGSTKVTLDISFKGEGFEQFNNLHSDYTVDYKDKVIRDYMPFENYEVITWDLKKLHRDTTRIELNATLILNKFLKPLGNEYYLSLFPCRIPGFVLPVNRTLPVELPYPICNSDSLIYNLPAGYELKTKLEPVSIQSEFGSFQLMSNVTKGKVYVIKRFELLSGSYSIKQYPAFYAFIQSVKDMDKKKIIIKPIN